MAEIRPQACTPVVIIEEKKLPNNPKKKKNPIGVRDCAVINKNEKKRNKYQQAMAAEPRSRAASALLLLLLMAGLAVVAAVGPVPPYAERLARSHPHVAVQHSEAANAAAFVDFGVEAGGHYVSQRAIDHAAAASRVQGRSLEGRGNGVKAAAAEAALFGFLEEHDVLSAGPAAAPETYLRHVRTRDDTHRGASCAVSAFEQVHHGVRVHASDLRVQTCSDASAKPEPAADGAADRRSTDGGRSSPGRRTAAVTGLKALSGTVVGGMSARFGPEDTEPSLDRAGAIAIAAAAALAASNERNGGGDNGRNRHGPGANADLGDGDIDAIADLVFFQEGLIEGRPGGQVRLAWEVTVVAPARASVVVDAHTYASVWLLAFVCL